ncbi:hypothetical protein C2E23DRAFT_886528 [Lenzites betulinus]|nr:hypothetical protein C2E23DRAFT_886528 [Lenzites betulinus]
MSYSLAVSIDPGVLPLLLRNGYKLCIARKVNSTYDVVWQAISPLAKNQFKWTSDTYRVFGAEPYRDGAPVRILTQQVDIRPGQTAIMDKLGLMNPPTGPPDNSNTFRVQNSYGVTNIAMSSYVNESYAPVFIFPTDVIPGTISFTPQDQVIVSFNPDRRTQSVRYTDAAKWVLDGTQSAAITALDVDESRPKPEKEKDRGAVPVAVAVTFETEREAHAFAEHARKHVPEDMSKWDVSAFDKTIRATVAVEGKTKGEMTSIDLAMKAFLDVLYSFPGAKYKSLTYTVLPHKEEKHEYSATAAVCFSSAQEADRFAERVKNSHSSDVVNIEGIVHGPAVAVKLSVKDRDEVSARERGRCVYDEVIAECQRDAKPVYIGPLMWGMWAVTSLTRRTD